MKKVIAIVLTLALLMMGAAFAETDAGDVEYVGEINVGTAFMLTGTYASVGVRAENAIKMVIDEVNANGGVQGYKINLISQDTSGDTDTAINAINLLVEDDVVAILGPHFSSQVYAVRDIIEEAGIPTIVGGTNFELPSEDNHALFLGRTNDLIQAAAAANYVVQSMDASKVGIMYCSDDFGTGAYQVISEIFEENGLEYEAEVHNTTDTDYYSTLLKMQDAGCDTVVVWTQGDAMAIIVRQINELGLADSINFMTSPGLFDSIVMNAVDHAWLDGLFAVQEFFSGIDDPDTQAFVAKNEEMYNENLDFLTGAYAGIAYVLVDALERAEDPTDSASVIEALEATQDLKTPISTYTCDEMHRLNFSVSICGFDSEADSLYFVEQIEG